MASEVSQSDIDAWQGYIDTGNYTQFYFELYGKGSTIAGLYIPGPTGQGIFGNYSYAHVSSVLGEELTPEQQNTISSAIASGLLDEILNNPTGTGGYRLLSDIEFLTKEIDIFTGTLGYPSEAYPGHDMIDFLGLSVSGSIDASIFNGPLFLASAISGYTQRYILIDGHIHTEAEAEAHGIIIYGGTLIDGLHNPPRQLESVTGVFEYKGIRYLEKDLINEDGILYAITEDYGTIPVGVSFFKMIELVASVGGDTCFLASTPITMSDGTTKPVEDIRVGDKVLSYDPNGPVDAPLTAKTVTELFRNEVTHILDVHGLMVTPGHVTLCGDGPHKGRHVPMIDILCSDGALVRADGTLIRVATNARVGSTEDAFVKLAYALTSKDAKNGQLQAGEIRVGTLLFDHEGVPVSVLDCLRAEGLDFDPDTGLVQRGDSPAAPLNFFGHPPKPEDYILKRSEAKLADILADGEWEDVGVNRPGCNHRDLH